MCAASSIVRRCGWCVLCGLKRFAKRRRRWKSRLAASTRRLRPHARCEHPAAARRSGKGRARARRTRAGTRQTKAAGQREGRRRSRAAAVVRSADCAAGAGGLMDGSVSTLAPVFAAAFATHKSWDAFLVGLAASAGAGISMGFAEALSDDGSLTGRGHPWVRGLICGAMTALGGIGHTLPFLIQRFPRGAVGRGRGGGGRIGRDHLDPQPLYGYAVGFGGAAGRAWAACWCSLPGC